MLKLEPIGVKKLIAKNYYKIGLLILTLNSLYTSDFAQAPNITYTTPQVYTLNTPITPLPPNNIGGPITTTGYGLVSTFAGNLTPGSANGTGAAASFNLPQSIAIDANGNLYVADFNNKAIRKITPAGAVTTFASGLNGPTGVAVDNLGNVFVADYMSNTIKKITPAGAVSVFAGSGTPGLLDGTGTAANFKSPYGVAVDANNNVYVADMQNNAIRQITPTGVVTTLAGNGTNGQADGTGAAARFTLPGSLAVDATGNIFVSDGGNNSIRKITPAGVVTTVAGLGGPTALNNLNLVGGGLKIDNAGNIIFAHEGKNSILKITLPATSVVIAGSVTAGSADGIGASAGFNRPQDVVLDNAGNVYVADQNNNEIRKISPNGYTIDKPLPAGLIFNPVTGIISGTPTITSPATVYTITAFNGSGSSTTTVNITVLATALLPSIITFPKIPPNNGLPILTPTATSTNTEIPIVYTSSNTAVAIITPDGKIQLVGPGTTTITATQAGDANYAPAIPQMQGLIVTESQGINFPAFSSSGNRTTCDADFSAGATSSNSTIPLTYASSNPAVATITSAGFIHIVGVGTTTITVSQAGNTLYTPAPPQSQTLTISLPVALLVTISPDQSTVCAGTAVTFTANVSNAGTNAILNYQWQVNGITASTNPSFITTKLSSTDVVTCIVTNTAACSGTATSNSKSIVVNPVVTPQITIISSATTTVCRGTAITFTATATNGGTNPIYQWEVNGATVNPSTSQVINGPQFTSSTLSANDKVTCILINNDSPCVTNAVTQSNTIAVSFIPPPNPPPTVNIIASATTAYPGILITFTATASNAGTALRYQWQINGVNAGANNPVFTSSTLNNGDIVSCILLLSQGCIPTITSNQVKISIVPSPTVTVPNTFTPNGDGINDLWVIPDLVSYPNCLVTIFTRYGEQIYQSKGYSKPWEGIYKGSQLPMGVYYYLINLGNKTPALSGWVAIVR